MKGQFMIYDYPQCMICENAEIYEDDSFICIYENDNQIPLKNCDVFGDDDASISPFSLVSVLEKILERLKKLEEKEKN